MHPEETALLQDVHASPRLKLHRRIYADWLEDNGDPEYADFIRRDLSRDEKNDAATVKHFTRKVEAGLPPELSFLGWHSGFPVVVRRCGTGQMPREDYSLRYWLRAQMHYSSPEDLAEMLRHPFMHRFHMLMLVTMNGGAVADAEVVIDNVDPAVVTNIIWVRLWESLRGEMAAALEPISDRINCCIRSPYWHAEEPDGP